MRGEDLRLFIEDRTMSLESHKEQLWCHPVKNLQIGLKEGDSFSTVGSAGCADVFAAKSWDQIEHPKPAKGVVLIIGPSKLPAAFLVTWHQVIVGGLHFICNTNYNELWQVLMWRERLLLTLKHFEQNLHIKTDLIPSWTFEIWSSRVCWLERVFPQWLHKNGNGLLCFLIWTLRFFLYLNSFPQSPILHLKDEESFSWACECLTRSLWFIKTFEHVKHWKFTLRW